MPEIFISYAHSTGRDAQRVATALGALGYEVWRDDDLPPHRAYEEVIQERLDASRAVLVLWSADAVRSQWVRSEANRAREAEKLVQVSLDGVLPPMPFDQIHCVPLTASRALAGVHWERVTRAIGELVGREPVSAAEPSRGGRIRSPARPAIPIAAGAAAILLAGGGGWFAIHAMSPGPIAPPSVTVESFQVPPGDAAAQQFAALAPSEIEGVLTENQLETIPLGGAGAAHPATFLLRGSVGSAQAGGLASRIEAIDAATDRSFWSDEFHAPPSDADALRKEIGWAAAQVFSIAADARRQVGAVADDQALALYVQARQFRKPELGIEGNAAQREALAAQVVEAAPRFSAAHSLHGLTLIDVALVAQPDDFAQMTARARAEANEALTLDAHNGEAYLVLAALEPGPAWSARETWIKKAMSVDPDRPSVLASYAWFLSNVGRLDEAVSFSERGIAQRRCEPAFTAPHGRILYDAGRVDEAISHLKGQMIVRPDDWCIRWVTLETLALRGPVDQAETMLDDVAQNPLDLSPAAADAWRAFLEARRRPTPVARAAAASMIKDAAKPKDMLTCGLAFRRAVSMFAELERPDDAFALAQSYAEFPFVRRMARSMEPEFLFGPDAVSLRRDGRFIALADELGLLAYWRASGRWPDFCAKERQSVCGQMKNSGKAGA